MTPTCIRALFSREPSKVQAQQRVDRDASEADQEICIRSIPRSPRSGSQTAAAKDLRCAIGQPLTGTTSPSARISSHPTVNPMFLIREQRFGPRAILVHRKITICRKYSAERSYKFLARKGEERKIGCGGGAYSRITCSLATVQSGSQTGGLARQANCHLLDVCSASITLREPPAASEQGQLNTNISSPPSNVPSDLAVPVSV